MVGAWNTGILTPQWLSKEIFKLSKNEKYDIEISQDVSVSLRAKIRDIYIIPTPDRLILNPSKHNKRLLTLLMNIASRLYKTLPHTPIVAIGHNFFYELNKDEEFNLDLNFSGRFHKKNYNNINAIPVKDSTLRHSLSLKNDKLVTLNLSYRQDNSKRSLETNYHYQVNRDDKKIKHALRRFLINYNNSVLVCSKSIIRR